MTQPIVIWEVTRFSDVRGFHAARLSPDNPRSEELSTYEAYKTIDQIALLKPAELILTGGDPLARHDILEIIDYSRRRGLAPAVHLFPSERLTVQAIDKLKPSGAARVIFSLHGVASHRHDAVSGMRGSFAATMNAIAWANRAGIPIEIQTLLTRRTLTDLLPISELLIDLGVQSWCINFLVSSEKSSKSESLTAQEADRAFDILASIESNTSLRIRTIEAPEYRRHLMQCGKSDAIWGDFANYMTDEVAEHAIDDIVFIEAAGAVRPSEFLPLVAGNVRYRPLVAIVRASDLFVAFRDRSNLTGKCGRCDYKQLCGGSRARAWAATGLLFGPDPICSYQPPMEVKEATS